MKKSLIALAVLASVAGVAQAQSSVQLYGIVDLVIHKDKGVSAAMKSGGVSSSRWGLKGSEDLGGGLKANFLLEQGFDADTGTVAAGTQFGRQSYVGLSGGFGEVKVGKPWTAYDDVAGAADAVFGANVLSPLNMVFNSWTNYEGNPGNTIYYATPSFGGVSGAFSHTLKEANIGATNDFHVKYEGGPLTAAFAYQDAKVDAAKYTTVNATYDLGVAKLLATVARVNNATAADVSEYALGADIPLGGAMVLSVGYGSSKTKGVAAAKSVSAGLAYVMSKRTTVYAGFADGNAQAAKAVAAGGRSTPDSRVGFGLKHTF